MRKLIATSLLCLTALSGLVRAEVVLPKELETPVVAGDWLEFELGKTERPVILKYLKPYLYSAYQAGDTNRYFSADKKLRADQGIDTLEFTVSGDKLTAIQITVPKQGLGCDIPDEWANLKKVDEPHLNAQGWAMHFTRSGTVVSVKYNYKDLVCVVKIESVAD